MNASHRRYCSLDLRSRKDGNRGFSLLELVASLTIFASFIAGIVLAVQASRAPQYEAVSRYTLLEAVVDLLEEEVASPQEAMFLTGQFNPPSPCPESTSTSCLQLGATEFIVSWTVSQRADLGVSAGPVPAVSLTASVEATDGVVYQRSATVTAPAFTSPTGMSSFRIQLTGEPSSATAKYRPIQISDGSGVVAAMFVDTATGIASGSLPYAACSSGCTLPNGETIFSVDGAVVDLAYPFADLTLATAALDPEPVTVGQGFEVDWVPTASFPSTATISFASGGQVWAESCLPAGCKIEASPTAPPGTYILQYTTTSGSHGTVEVTVESNVTVIYSSDAVVPLSGSADIEIITRDGSGNPISAPLCLRPAADVVCDASTTSDSSGLATVTIAPTTSGEWLISSPDSSAQTVINVTLISNLSAISATVSAEGGVATVTVPDLASTTPISWSGVLPEGAFGPAASTPASADGVAELQFSVASEFDLSGIEICIEGTENCVVLP